MRVGDKIVCKKASQSFLTLNEIYTVLDVRLGLLGPPFLKSDGILVQTIIGKTWYLAFRFINLSEERRNKLQNINKVSFSNIF